MYVPPKRKTTRELRAEATGDDRLLLPDPGCCYEYAVEQLWAGWWGGWGDDEHVEDRCLKRGAAGWQLVDSRSALRLWLWFFPREKLLLFFARRVAPRVATDAPRPPA